jgi:hypothetical protein
MNSQDTQVLSKTKPTSQDIKTALINVLKAGLYYRKPKDGKFMLSYKDRVNKLRQAADREEHVLKLAQTIFPNEDKYNLIMNEYKSWYGRDPRILNAIMELYKLYYELAKDNFVKEEQLDDDIEDFLNL